MSKKKLSIIIISYNTKDLLKQTIDSIRPNKDWEIIVVDNASSDDSVSMLKKDYPKIHLIENKENKGFAAANNQALKIVKGEYSILLNSDTIVVDDAFERMLKYMDENPEVGMITPKLVLRNGEIDIACHRGMPTPWRSFTYFTKLEKLIPQSKAFGGYHLTNLNLEETHQIEATAGTAMMVRQKAIDEVGLLDERFFFYAEDLDWCLRFTQLDWKIVYYPESVVLHYKSASGKKNKKDKQKAKAAKAHFWDTMKQFYEKHYSNKYPWPIKKVVYLGIDLKKRFS